MAISIEAIRALAAVDDQQSFTRAADVLGITQPSISQRLSRLEDEVETVLIDRKSKRATTAGRILIDRGRRAERELSLAREELDELLGLRTGSLHVGITHWIGAFDLAELLAEFHRDHPGIAVSLSEDDSETMLDMLDAVRLDLVVSNVAPGEPVRQGMERLVIGEEPLALVAHRGASTRRGSVAALRSLAGVEMVSFGPRTSLRQIVDAAIQELGVSPRIAFETNQPDIMKNLIARGMAWSIVPYSLARTWSPVLQLWRLKTRTVRRVGLTWSLGRALQPAAVVFRDRLQQRTSDL